MLSRSYAAAVGREEHAQASAGSVDAKFRAYVGGKLFFGIGGGEA